MRRDSSVGIVTRYRLDGRMPLAGEIFYTRPDWLWNSLTSYTTVTESFPGVKRPGRCVDHPPLSRAEFKERVELYLYFPSGSSWFAVWSTLPYPFTNPLADPGGRAKAWVCGLLLAGIAGSNPAGGIDVCLS